MKKLTVLFLLILAGCGGSSSQSTLTPTNTMTPINISDNVFLPVVDFQFNDIDDMYQTFDSASGEKYFLDLNGFKKESIESLQDSAWRTNGFSNFLQIDNTYKLDHSFSIMLQVALASYPENLETPLMQQNPGSLFTLFNNFISLDLFLNSYGQWGFRIIANDDQLELMPESKLPLHEWVNVLFTYDNDKRQISIYLNGVEVAMTKTPSDLFAQGLANAKLNLARPMQPSLNTNTIVNGINGAYDKFIIWDELLSDEQIKIEMDKHLPTELSLQTTRLLTITNDRFLGDLHRPKYHPMPPANWTNEPHGLVYFNNQYHLFYQRGANSPVGLFKSWGQLVSNDLVRWTTSFDALLPSNPNEQTFDSKGIWSGDVFIKDSKAYAFYTSVNHTSEFNPSISLAVSDTNNLQNWSKLGPLFDKGTALDMRDPYLWEDNGKYHMLVGAKLSTGGGLVYYTSNDLLNWSKLDNFSTIDYSEMDIYSNIWEMPVFEKLIDETYILVVNPIGNSVSKNDEINPTRPVYWTGSWNGRQFSPYFSEPKNLDIIPGYLAPSVSRSAEDKLVAIGIVDERRSAIESISSGWSQALSIAREWYLMGDGLSIGQIPSENLVSLRREKLVDQTNWSFEGTEFLGNSRTLEAIIEFEVSLSNEIYGLILGANSDGSESTKLTYHVATQELTLDRTTSSLNSNVNNEKRTEVVDIDTYGVPTKFHVFIDHSVVNVFINDAVATSFRIYPSLGDSDSLGVFSDSSLVVNRAQLWQLSDGSIDDITFLVIPTSQSEVAQGVRLPYANNVVVLGAFDNALDMLENGWITTGDFKQPSDAEAWKGTTGVTKVGLNAVSTCEINFNAQGCDRPLGEFLSPTFTVSPESTWLAMLMSGGDGSVDVGMELIDADTNELLIEHRPSSCAPSYINGNEDWISFNLEKYQNRNLQIRIKDRHDGPCGFISFDHIHLRTTPLN